MLVCLYSTKVPHTAPVALELNLLPPGRLATRSRPFFTLSSPRTLSLVEATREELVALGTLGARGEGWGGLISAATGHVCMYVYEQYVRTYVRIYVHRY